MTSLITQLQLSLARVIDEERGQGLTEYALILVLVALIAIIALTFLGGQVSTEVSTVANTV